MTSDNPGAAAGHAVPHRRFSPPTVVAPPSRHAQAVASTSGLRWLHLSGQIGLRPDGSTVLDHAGQHEQVWRNILALLAADGMQAEHLVKATAYVTSREQVALYRDTRDRLLGGVEIASTLVVVAALAHPDWVVEIDAVAAA